jgi:hypothetical protein
VTDEHVDTGSKTTVPPDAAEPDENRARTDYAETGLRNWWRAPLPEELALATALAVYSKAFLEAVARRHADGVTDRVSKWFRDKGKGIEAVISLPGDASATVVVTADLPDEARLALLDLDVTSDKLHGKTLRWDGSASAWRPDPDD